MIQKLITKLQNYKITKLQNYKITKFSSAFFVKNFFLKSFFSNSFLNLFSSSFFNQFSFKNFFFKNSFFYLLFFLFFFSCKPKITVKDTPTYDVNFYLIIDNRDGKQEQDKEQKKYSFSLEEGSKFSKERLDKLQKEFLDKNSTGYTFDGWYSDEKLATKKITAENLAEISINEKKVFYGKMLLIGGPPTDISLSANSIDENKAIGTVIGNLTTTDATAGDSFTYSLVTGDGDDDNSDFSIDGDKLKSAKKFDFESKNSYQIRIKTSDVTGLTFEKKITIKINDLNGWITFNELTNPYREDEYVFKEVTVNGNGRFIKVDQTLGINAIKNIGGGNTKYLVLDFTKNLVNTPVKGTDFIVNGLPANLDLKSATVNKILYIWLNGAAVNHANSDDTTFTITFNKSIYAAADRPASNDDILERTMTFKLDFSD